MKKEEINPEIKNAGAAKPVSDEKWETPEMSVISAVETKEGFVSPSSDASIGYS